MDAHRRDASRSRKPDLYSPGTVGLEQDRDGRHATAVPLAPRAGRWAASGVRAAARDRTVASVTSASVDRGASAHRYFGSRIISRPYRIVTLTHPVRSSATDLALARELLALGPHFGRLACRAAEACGAGSPERGRLLALIGPGPERPGHLARQLRLSPATVSELVDALVGEGLVRRHDDPDDRRAVDLELTAEGRRQRRQYERAVAALLAEVVGRLTAAQQRRLRAAFADMHTAFAAASPHDVTVHPIAPRERSHVR